MEKTTFEPVSGVDLALCRASLYEALSLGFCGPTAETVHRLGSPAGILALADAGVYVDSALGDLISGLGGNGTNLESLGTNHRILFGHTVRGAVPPYETEYGVDGLFLQPQEMSDIGGFMQAFGLEINPQGHQRIDHISCECELLSFLCHKEAYALERNEDLMLEETRRAQQLFLKDHLGRFGPAFGRRVFREDPDGFYGTMGELCAEFIEGECRRMSIPVGPDDLQLRSALPDNVPMACGGAEVEPDLIDIEGANEFQTP